MTTYERAEQLAGEILQAFEDDMRRAPNVCFHCRRSVTWPCDYGAVYMGGGKLALFPLCPACAEKAREEHRAQA